MFSINGILGTLRPFRFRVKTDNAGVSTSTQFTLPLEASGTYDFTINWGDASSNNITVWNQAETTHTYSVAGTYNISITGRLVGWTFNNGGDRLKFLEVNSWGGLRLGNSGGYFFGCQNLVLGAVSDVLNLVGTTNFNDAFRNCDAIVSINNLQLWNTSAITIWWSAFRDMSLYNDPNFQYLDMSSATTLESLFRFSPVFNQPIPLYWPLVTNTLQMFNDAHAFNQPMASATMGNVTTTISMFNRAYAFNQDISNWDVSSVQFMHFMFNASAFNQDISSWDTSNVQRMDSMFQNTSFNQAIGGWNVSSLEQAGSMFREAYAFDQNIGSWDVSNLLDATNFMLNKTAANFSTANLDAIYNGWSTLTLQPNVTIGFGTIKYSALGVAGRLVLNSAPNNWTITDGGI
jgi:surface protein